MPYRRLDVACHSFGKIIDRTTLRYGQFFFVMSIIFILLAAIFSSGCHHRSAGEEPNIQVVKTEIVQTLVEQRRDFAALSTADDASNLAFKIGGRVLDIPVAKGMMVRRGQLLAELDDRDVRLQVDAAKAAYNEALSRLNRARRLFAHDAIALQEVESLESSVAQSLSTYRNAMDMLADTRITAPFDGVIERTYVDAFQRVASGETVVRIVKPRSTTVSFTAPESLVGVLALPTTHFVVRFDAYPYIGFKAVIKSFARTSSDALGFPTSLRLVDVDTARYDISPGMTCIATVITPESDSSAVVVPLTAIYAPAEGGDYVWVVTEDSTVERRAVDIGSLVGQSSVEVLDGLSSGDRVVSAGVYHLSDGERVQVLQ